ncbi:hypothetical protein POM88_037729 [Heracleum sosnowskyi]|uniref:Uncharacterized protein n=1 Tax=Heracleum sosnowskyi TaxID=360622 RepID=A0AAD8HSG9_9APIA|nr:hypothetical protein POM88_037729 [Heracleum sosnowskyi]
MRSTNKSCLKSQVKFINLIDNDCPRLNSSVVVRTPRFFKWSHRPGEVTFIPRIIGGFRIKKIKRNPRLSQAQLQALKKTKRPNQKPRLSGFFQAQLRMMKGLQVVGKEEDDPQYNRKRMFLS